MQNKFELKYISLRKICSELPDTSTYVKEVFSWLKIA